MISYSQLLEIFWQSHYPAAQPYKRQYASIIFYHNDQQKDLALAAFSNEEIRQGKKLYTEVIPFENFTLAEDYHQKYYLQSNTTLFREYQAIYPDRMDFINSTAAARVNGYVGYNGSLEQLEQEIDLLGLSPQGKENLLRVLGKQSSYRPGCSF